MAQSADDVYRAIRLRQEQEKAIQETDEKLDTFDKYKSDYIALKTRLQTLTDKVAYDIMVPFGKLAFMPGKLVNTNNILVLLGDNWFAEMSAKQATQTVDRRLKVLDEQIQNLHQQKSLLEPRLTFTSELEDLAMKKGDIVEIKEEYDQEKEKLWQVEHKKKVEAYNRQRREEEQLARHAAEERCDDEVQLWDRLDELEEQEARRGELRSLERRGSDSQSQSSDSEDDEVGKSVRWKDKNTHKTIQFSHSKTADVQKELSGSSTETLNSPADIYKHFVKQKNQQKSILKNPLSSGHSPCSGESDTAGSGGASQSNTATESDALSRVVLERRTPAESENISRQASHSADNIARETEDQQPKKISKFKAQRLAKK